MESGYKLDVFRLVLTKGRFSMCSFCFEALHTIYFFDVDATISLFGVLLSSVY